MSKSRIDKIIKLAQCGWRPYEGQATGEAYDKLGCDKRRRGYARWFARANVLVCVGCEISCTLTCPEGFQLPLFTYPSPSQASIRLTPQELLSKRIFLTVNEAAYILNMSPRQFRTMIYEGHFRVTKEKPMRVKAEEVRAFLDKVDYWESAVEQGMDEKATAMI